MKYQVTISESRTYAVEARSEDEAIGLAFSCKRLGWDDQVDAIGAGPVTVVCAETKEVTTR